MLIIFFIFCMVIYSFSPIVSVFFCLIYAIVRHASRSTLECIVVGFVISLSMATIYSGKLLILASSTDFLIYYQYYQQVASGVEWSEFRFEPGYYILTWLLTYFHFNEIQYSIVMSFISIYANYLAVLCFAKKRYDAIPLLLVCVMSCFLFKIGSLALLWRQSISCAFIIFALSSSRYISYIAVIISALFHISSIYLYPMLWFFLNKEIKPIYYYIVFFSSSILFLIKTFAYQYLPAFLINTFSFAFGMEFQFMHFMDALKTIIYFVPVICVVLFLSNNKDLRNTKDFQLILFISFFIMCISFLPHSFRILFPYSVVLLAFFSTLILVRLRTYYPIMIFTLIFLGMCRFISSDLAIQYDLVMNKPFEFWFVNAK
ncbi:EpsG family protein [Aeromonas veronii]|uniref:EpsG family protein n=2 Tax=Aeromonas veronii TaxID=654 RepID=UPI003F78E15D